jgi:sugar lactone lactonase YvrE
MPTAELILDAHALVGEGPVWLPDSGELLWVDIESSTVHWLDPATGADRALDVGGHVGAVLPDRSGGLILALPRGLARLQPGSGAPMPLVGLNDDPGLRLNDAKVDPRGRLFVGSMSYAETAGVGTLWRVDPDLSVTTVLQGLTVSNGMDWSPDLQTMYFIDSGDRHIDVLDYDVETGAAVDRRVFYTQPDDRPGAPDGMCLDADGNLWVAIWGGHCVLALTPDGTLHERVDVAAPQVASCAFGGDGLRTLFITTATSGLAPEVLAAEPHAGGVFAVDVGVAGRPATLFVG